MKSIDNQSGYWDGASSSKTFTHPLDVRKFQNFISKKSHVLDFGCGYGRTCNELHKLGYTNIKGVDSSELMIDRGRREFPHLDLEAFRDNDRQANTNPFDAIILFAVLTCIPTDDGQRQLVDKLSHLLRPGGILYVSDYWLQSDQRNLVRYRQYEEKYNRHGVFELPEGAVVRHHSKDWLNTLFGGFETLDMVDCQLTSMNGNPSSCFQFIGRWP